jgi:hypothetical protein
MNKSYNFKKRVGGAESLGDSIMGSSKERSKKYCSLAYQHKWMTKRTSRTCRLCGFHQYLISKEKGWDGKEKLTYSADRPLGYRVGGTL